MHTLTLIYSPHRTKELTLYGTNDGDLGPNDSNAKPYRTATITRIKNSNDWSVAVWYPYEFAIARPLGDRQSWLQEVQNNYEVRLKYVAVLRCRDLFPVGRDTVRSRV